MFTKWTPKEIKDLKCHLQCVINIYMIIYLSGWKSYI